MREGEPATFGLIAIDPAGARIDAKGVQWTLKKLTTTYQWYASGGSWTYEPVTSARKVGGRNARHRS